MKTDGLILEPKPMKVKLPVDLISRIEVEQITTLSSVELLRIPVWNEVKVGFFERLAFYVKKVLPFTLEILKFYFPVSVPFIHLYQNSIKDKPMNEKSLIEAIQGYASQFLSRWLLKVGGGFLLAHGVSEGSIEEISGAVISIAVGIVISLVNHKKALNSDPAKP